MLFKIHRNALKRMNFTTFKKRGKKSFLGSQAFPEPRLHSPPNFLGLLILANPKQYASFPRHLLLQGALGPHHPTQILSTSHRRAGFLAFLRAAPLTCTALTRPHPHPGPGFLHVQNHRTPRPTRRGGLH